MTFTMVPGSMSTNTDPGWDRAPNTDIALGFSLDLGVIMTLGSSTDHIDLYGRYHLGCIYQLGLRCWPMNTTNVFLTALENLWSDTGRLHVYYSFISWCIISCVVTSSYKRNDKGTLRCLFPLGIIPFRWVLITSCRPHFQTPLGINNQHANLGRGKQIFNLYTGSLKYEI